MPLFLRPLRWLGALVVALLIGGGAVAAPDAEPAAASAVGEYLLAPHDVVHVAVFQNADLTLDAVVDERGNIAYPLVGSVHIGGGSLADAEKLITKALRDGGFLVAPQVRVSLVQVKGSLVTVLGHVAHPGRYSLDSSDLKVSDLIALAGGLASDGADIVVLTGERQGRPIRREINVRNIGQATAGSENLPLRSGDLLYVDRAPMFFIYGEVQRPGTYRLDGDMTVMQALATGGGLTPKGTQRGLTIHRKTKDGKTEIIEPKLDDTIRVDDVLYIQESLF
jgi:polysaccharide export outer membrane protein